MLRVLAVLPYPLKRAPGQRYRIEQWAPLLATEGVETSFAPFLSVGAMDILYRRGHTLTKVWETCRGYSRRLATLLRPLPFDVVYVYREAALLGTAWIEWLLARRRPLVFDFDDAIHLPSSADANRLFAKLKSRNKTKTICTLARHVTVGNEELASYARRYSAAVTVIPSTIDTDEYRMEQRPDNASPVVGWTGSPTTVRYVEALVPVFEELARRIGFQLRIIGGEVRMPGVNVKCIPWRADSEVADLRPLDVGLMPLADDEWSRGKCGLKALQYMALGVPPVVSPVGVNATLVKHGVNGFHARTHAEWVDHIESLLRDRGLRVRLGLEARRTVEGRFSARVQAPRMAEVLRSAGLARRR